MDSIDCAPCVSRRAALAGAGAAATVIMSGCQAYGDTPAADAPIELTPGSATPSASGGTAAPPAAPPSSGAAAGPPALAQIADIPVGGGKIFEDKKVVVTQPQAGTIKAFSSVCTHAGCAVTEVKGGTINCKCHNSKFKVADGTVAGGPAPKGLAAVKVTVEGGAISLA